MSTAGRARPGGRAEGGTERQRLLRVNFPFRRSRKRLRYTTASSEIGPYLKAMQLT